MANGNGTKKAWWKPVVYVVASIIAAGGGGFGIYAQSDSSTTKTAVESVQREMNQRDDRITKITDTVLQNVTDIASMKSDIKNTREDVGELKDDFKVMQGDMSSVKNSVGNIEYMLKTMLNGDTTTG